MTLCLAQSLVDREGEFVVNDQIRKYVRWMEDGYMSANGRCFDIGNATSEALGIWKVSMEGAMVRQIFEFVALHSEILFWEEILFFDAVFTCHHQWMARCHSIHTSLLIASLGTSPSPGPLPLP